WCLRSWWFLRRMGGVPMGSRPLPTGIDNAAGREQHTSSSVATPCDYGILPFGLSHSGGQPCQNRITGHTRTAPLRYITAGQVAGILHSGRKIFGGTGDREWSGAAFGAPRPVAARLSRSCPEIGR